MEKKLHKWEYTVPNEKEKQTLASFAKARARLWQARPETIQSDCMAGEGFCITAFCELERMHGKQVLLGHLTSPGVVNDIINYMTK